MGRVQGKVAFITGVARGQGRSHALRLAQEGADIIGVDLVDHIPHVSYASATDEDVAETQRLIAETGRKFVFSKADVRDRDALKMVIDSGVSDLGKLDIVVANAGIHTLGSWDEVTPEIWEHQIGVNLTGAWNTLQLTTPHLIANGGGSIILTSSTAGIKGLPFMSQYTASKHGVVGLMKSYASELAEHYIRVNSIHPTGVNTPMTSNAGATFERLLEQHPRLGGMLVNTMPVDLIEPADVSNAVLFLASDEARWITSLQMTIDAGVSQY